MATSGESIAAKREEEECNIRKSIDKNIDLSTGLSACMILALPMTEKMKPNFALSIGSTVNAKGAGSTHDLGNKHRGCQI